MSKYQKRLLCLFLPVLFLVGSSYLYLVWEYDHDGTVYSDGFSDEKFKNIQVGMPVDQVHSILGAPLAIYESRPFEVWNYGDPIRKKDEGYGEIQFVLGSSDQIWFDAQGRIIRTNGQRLEKVKSGQTKSEVLKALGEPQSKDSSLSVRFECYTKPPRIGRFQERAIGYDNNGRVCEISKRELNYD